MFIPVAGICMQTLLELLCIITQVIKHSSAILYAGTKFMDVLCF